MTTDSPIAAPVVPPAARVPAPTGARRAVARGRHAAAQLWRFGMIQLQCCGFAIAVIAGLAGSTLLRGYWDAPILRYDALLLYLVVVQALFLLTRLETPGELMVICVFHLAGLSLEWFKVAVGSWHYPEPGVATLGGVPLYAGFMYAAVGSYICQAFRRFDLKISNYRLGLVGVLAALAYVNFFTHHVIVDLRYAIMAGFLLACARMRIWFTVGACRYWMPLPLSFVLIGFFLWVAENLATYFGAWEYPEQAAGWQLVHPGKFGSWVLLVSLSFVLVTALYRRRPLAAR